MEQVDPGVRRLVRATALAMELRKSAHPVPAVLRLALSKAAGGRRVAREAAERGGQHAFDFDAHPQAPAGGEDAKGKHYTGGEFVPALKDGDPHPMGHAPSTAQARAVVQERGHGPIPPTSWGLWVNPDPEGDLQAKWYDAKGRQQYRYSARHAEEAQAHKLAALQAFGAALPALRARVESDLSLDDAAKRRVAAAVVRLIDRTSMRVGGEEYARENGTYGASSLRREHLALKGSVLVLRFPGKHAVAWQREVRDAALAKVVRHLKTLPGQRVFQYHGPKGDVVPLAEGDVRDYLRPFGVTPKQFRTYAATKMAREELLKAGKPSGEKEARTTIAEVVKHVAAHLGNTPAVCRGSYISPVVLDSYARGRLT